MESSVRVELTYNGLQPSASPLWLTTRDYNMVHPVRFERTTHKLKVYCYCLLSYGCIFGAFSRTWTYNLPIKSRVLCQLSYKSIWLTGQGSNLRMCGSKPHVRTTSPPVNILVRLLGFEPRLYLLRREGDYPLPIAACYGTPTRNRT